MVQCQRFEKTAIRDDMALDLFGVIVAQGWCGAQPYPKLVVANQVSRIRRIEPIAQIGIFSNLRKPIKYRHERDTLSAAAPDCATFFTRRSL